MAFHWLVWWLGISEHDIEQLTRLIQYNLQRIIAKADEISQEFRRTIHLDVTSKRSTGKLRILRDLLETDNMVRDVLAKLKQAKSKLAFDERPQNLLRDEIFLEELYANLAEMFKSFDEMTTIMETDFENIDQLVLDTINVLDQFNQKSLL